MSFDQNGLTVKREPELITDIEGYQQENIPTAFDYQDNKLIYQLNSVYSKSSAEIYELLEIVYDSIALSKAEGIWLDELALLRGVTRIPASSSFTNTQEVALSPLTTIPAGSVWGSSRIPQQATNSNPVVANESSSYETILLFSNSIDSQPDGITYTIVVNAQSYSYVSQPSDTSSDVVAGIIAEIDLDTDKTFVYATATNSSGTSLILTPDAGTTLSTSVLNTLITTQSIKVLASLVLNELGPVEVPAGFMDTLVTAVNGQVTTSNPEDFVLGRLQETDEDLRLRVAEGPTTDCTGTILSIQSSLVANVLGVTNAEVQENVTVFPYDGVAIAPAPGSDVGFLGFPDGVPFGGYQTLVVGGADEDVAQDIWRTKPAGTPIVGNTQVAITDSSGKPRLVYFSRPEEVHLAFEVDYTRYDEETFPVNGESVMSDAVIAHTNALPLDEDVILGRTKCAIRAAVPEGIDELVIRVQQIAAPGDPTVPGNWQVVTFPISASQYATTTAQDITITDVTV